MLEKIRIRNFRGFEDHTVPLLPVTVLVGRNNAGKSTIVEALRLISMALDYAKSRRAVPSFWKISRTARKAKNQAPTLLSLADHPDTVFHRYGDPPASITAYFLSGAEVDVVVNPDEISATFSASRQDDLDYVSILPQVAPVSREERLLNPETVYGNLTSLLAPSHFRNQVHLLKDHFSAFKNAAEESWPHLRISAPEIVRKGRIEDWLTMMIQDEDFTAEIAWMGHGLQMWLQAIWFLTRARNHGTVILDEPDVYMHADLQRRLIRQVKRNHKQIIVATHSPEIMAEVEPEQILIINKTEAASIFASDLPVAQQVLNSLGSVHNLQFARLATTRRFLLVEGEDVGVLKRFQNTLFPKSNAPLDTLSMDVNGWGGWNLAIASARFLDQKTLGIISCYSVFDRDYHTEEERKKREKDAMDRGIEIHIWKKKELENYLLVPSAIERIIETRSASKFPKASVIADQIDKISEALRKTVEKSIGSEIQKQTRGIDYSTICDRAEKEVAVAWRNRNERWGIIPGKEALSQLSAWTQLNFAVSLTTINIAREMTAGEIDPEIVGVLTAFEKTKPFPH